MSDSRELAVQADAFPISENPYLKATLFTVIGCAMGGGWLVADLLLPEPWGDVVLEIVLAVVNGYLGWQAGSAIKKWQKRANVANLNRYLLPILLAVIGCATAAFWLAFDFLTPEPWGDYALYTVMAVVNGYIGWKIGRTIRKWQERANTATIGQSSRDQG